MKILKDILYGVSLKSFLGNRDEEIKGISFDSRKVHSGFIFIAIKGLIFDGHKYIKDAIDAGASAIVCEDTIHIEANNITIVKTDNSAKALGIIASNFYDKPSTKIKVIGITGTNGKTTCANLLYDLFKHLGYAVGLISTVENKIMDTVMKSTHTTPDALHVNWLLSEMVLKGCSHCFMEVSSHALIQNRVAGVQFFGGVFTNISHEHLDYHKTFENYIKAKKILFDELPANAFALVNSDDKRGAIMLQNTKAKKFRFALKSLAEYKIRIIHNTLEGLEIDFDGVNVWFNLIGKFNAYNLLTAFSVALILGEKKEEVLSSLSILQGAKGRFEKVENKSNILAIVDYAHTPDALENVLQTISELRSKNETFVTIIGCGGDRDKSKRPKIAKVATKFSDKVILTTDNPRSEDPKQILLDMQQGVPKSKIKNVMIIEDRKEAIRTAYNLVRSGDIILLAGKGHETYQEIDGKKYHFDDKEILSELLNTE